MKDISELTQPETDARTLLLVVLWHLRRCECDESVQWCSTTTLIGDDDENDFFLVHGLMVEDGMEAFMTEKGHESFRRVCDALDERDRENSVVSNSEFRIGLQHMPPTVISDCATASDAQSTLEQTL